MQRWLIGFVAMGLVVAAGCGSGGNSAGGDPGPGVDLPVTPDAGDLPSADVPPADEGAPDGGPGDADAGPDAGSDSMPADPGGLDGIADTLEEVAGDLAIDLPLDPGNDGAVADPGTTDDGDLADAASQDVADPAGVLDTPPAPDTSVPDEIPEDLAVAEDPVPGDDVPADEEVLGDAGADDDDPGDDPDAPDVASGEDLAADAGPVTPAVLCRPCAGDDDCVDRAGPAASCVEYPGEGRFCATSCDPAGCPAEYDCAGAAGREGAFCIHSSGACECSPESVAAGRWTPCVVTNPAGTCPGRRTCGAEGLSACDAPTPALESCDGTDQDCDGLTDEGTCDDGIPCTDDRCDGPTGTCSHVQAVGTCVIDGLCVAAGTAHPTDACVSCDPAVDPAGWSFRTGATCDDGDRCTTGDRCAERRCAGTPVTCPDRPAECVGAVSRTWSAGTCDAASGACAYTSTDLPCTAGCDAATGLCLPDPCAGVQCVTPPDARCFEPVGTCSGGTCSYVPLVPATPCDDGNGCTVGDACDGTGACVSGAPRDCTPPGPFCRGDDLVTTTSSCPVERGDCAPVETATPCAFGCDPGTATCRPDPCLGVTCDQPPATGCWDTAGTCAGGTCAYPPLAADLPCADGDLCTVGDRCDGAGACLAGAPKTCPAPVTACRGADLVTTTWGCDPGTGDCAAREDAVACPFGCDGATAACLPDPCAGVACDQPPAPTCWDPVGTCAGGTCTYTPMGIATPCADASACTLGDACDGNGACVPGAPKTCPAPVTACRGADLVTATAACQDPTGDCVPTETATPCTFGCDAALAVCKPDPCLGVVCSQPPSACRAALGTCSGGSCSYAPLGLGAPCDDADACTLGDACDGAGACVPGAPKSCPPPAPFCQGSDRVTSTASCVPATGECAVVQTATPCEFGCNAATATCLPDPCLGVVCNQPPTSCHEAGGTCIGGACAYAPRAVGAPCSDGQACTLDDACDAAQACVGTAKVCTPIPPACTPDGKSTRQTAGSCQEPAGTCTFGSVTTTCGSGCDAATGLCNAVVISQFRTRSGATGTDEFVELFNAGAVAVDISGWKLRGSNATGTAVSDRATVPAGTVMPPRGWFLFASTPANPPTPGYTGPVPGDVTYTTGITDNGGIAIVDAVGTIVDQVGMSTTCPFKEGSVLTPLTTGTTSPGYQRRTLGCGPDQDTGDNLSDFVLIPVTLPHNRFSCRPECFGTRCPVPAPACTDALTLTTWTGTCNALEQCETTGTPTACPFGCDATAGACRIDQCSGQPNGTACSDGDACSVGDACQDGACVSGSALSCEDSDPCTADSCVPATGCVHDAQACCGNWNIDPGEDCDDGNRRDGDGCSSTCHSDCPAGTVLEAGYCWVRATSTTETQAQACARVGRSPTPPEVPLTWDAAALARVATGFGLASAGDDGDFAPAMWCDDTTLTCDTHAFGATFFNYGRRVPAPNAKPVYTCALGTQPPVPLPTLTVHFVDVGQGDGMLLKTGTTEVVIDGGEFGSGMATYLQGFVEGPIEVVEASHAHTDHYGGLVEVLNKFQVKEIWYNGEIPPPSNTQWQQFWTAVQAQAAAGAVLRVVNRMNTASVGPLGFTLMSPGPTLTGDTNGDSIVMKLVHGTVGFDFTGDSIVSTESTILSLGYDPAAQILKLAHHGSRTSSSQAWLDAVHPEVAIYSAALGNPYGHPHTEVVNRVLAMGITLLGTDTKGTIKVETGGTTYSVTTQK